MPGRFATSFHVTKAPSRRNTTENPAFSERQFSTTLPWMDRRRILGGAAGILGLGAIGYAFFAPANDEELIAQVLDDLASSLSFSEPISNPIFFGSSLSGKFETIFTEQVQLSVSEVSGNIPSSRGKLGLVAAHALSRYGSMHVSISLDAVDVTGDSARCEATATVAAADGGQLRRDSRPVLVQLVKEDGDWLIRSARVEAPD